MHRNSLRRVLFALLLAAVLAPTRAVALPLISEVFYDAAGSDDGRSFVEIYGAPGTDLSGHRLEGINGANGAVTDSVLLGGAIPSDGFYVVADDVGDGTTEVVGADWIANFDFQNGYQTQAKSRAYAVIPGWFWLGCASAQGCVCQFLCQLRRACARAAGP